MNHATILTGIRTDRYTNMQGKCVLAIIKESYIIKNTVTGFFRRCRFFYN